MAYEYDPHVVRTEVPIDHNGHLHVSPLEVDDADLNNEHVATATIRRVKPEHCLGYLSTTSVYNST